MSTLAANRCCTGTIEAARQSGVIDRIIVSTESEAIAESARSAGAEVPLHASDRSVAGTMCIRCTSSSIW
ncbi:cytidylyltransferase domain-containing protein [uncultured Cohaesibacter sp.]|uniref:cytidylyltransferase domain-containing protein n=1 Tax=uncultured Cohaesibacter sp. TaxID=1002546 RepID=UPI00374A67D1